MIRILLISHLLLATSNAAAKEYISEKKNSKVLVSVDNKNSSSELIKLTFKTIPKVVKIGTMVINDQKNAPWSLEIKNPKGIKFSRLKLGKEDHSFSIPGFKLSAKPTGKNWGFDYKMRVFVCTKNKERCVTELHKGSVTL